MRTSSPEPAVIVSLPLPPTSRLRPPPPRAGVDRQVAQVVGAEPDVAGRQVGDGTVIHDGLLRVRVGGVVDHQVGVVVRVADLDRPANALHGPAGADLDGLVPAVVDRQADSRGQAMNPDGVAAQVGVEDDRADLARVEADQRAVEADVHAAGRVGIDAELVVGAEAELVAVDDELVGVAGEGERVLVDVSDLGVAVVHQEGAVALRPVRLHQVAVDAVEIPRGLVVGEFVLGGRAVASCQASMWGSVMVSTTSWEMIGVT